MTTFRIKRYHPESDAKPNWQSYELETDESMTILQALQQLREKQDPTLSWRSSCRMGVCGSCAMVVNGQAVLACNTRVHAVDHKAVRIEPLANLEVIKDLVTDLEPAMSHHKRLKPYIIRDDFEEHWEDGRELSQTPGELLDYMQFSYCMKCCACISACPTVAIHAGFPGPMPLAQAHRYNADTRDGGFEERSEVVSEHTDLAHCHYAGECSRVCPKGVDPARAIQLMKRDMVMSLFRRKRREPAKLVDPIPASPIGELDEGLVPPARTVSHSDK